MANALLTAARADRATARAYACPNRWGTTNPDRCIPISMVGRYAIGARCGVREIPIESQRSAGPPARAEARNSVLCEERSLP